MKTYSNKISLTLNSRGVYCIDTTIGCSSGMSLTLGGCYGDCYAAKSSKLYGYDFTKTVLRGFESRLHEMQILSQIRRVKLDFIRIGCSGDPSENWDHTLNVLKVISRSNKEIVIITRHWDILTGDQLKYLSTINVCFNTSVSALDNDISIQRSLEQYNRLKPFCKSMLRVVSCNFNNDNEKGNYLSKVQHNLFLNDGVIDTVFRPSKDNKFVAEGIIKVRKEVFNGKQQLASKFNKKTYMGKCSTCSEMCGQRMKNAESNYPNKRKLVKQVSLF